MSKKKKKKGKYLKVFSIKKKSVMADHQNETSPEQYSHDEQVVRRVAHKLEIAASSPDRNNLHIIARGEHWIIKREGAPKAHRKDFDSRAEAIQFATAMIERGAAARIYVHDNDGNVAQRI